jgi:hypothetical protein
LFPSAIWQLADDIEIPTQINHLAVSSVVTVPADHLVQVFASSLLMFSYDKHPEGVDVSVDGKCGPVSEVLFQLSTVIMDVWTENRPGVPFKPA